jgi:hypothetical protein
MIGCYTPSMKKFILIISLVFASCSRSPQKPTTETSGPATLETTVSNAPDCNAARLGAKSRENIFVTEQCYGHDPFFLGPAWQDLLQVMPAAKP